MGVINLEYGSDAGIEDLLHLVDRPGNFYVHGRQYVPMPRLEVEGAGMLAFPVPETQLHALIGAAGRAPYGRGPETVIDTSVRDCWQIGAERVSLSGGAWPETFAGILDRCAAGLGCPVERIEARLYKLLIYERGGFFSPHRDSEKAPGMVATLTISLPAAGEGGELIVRHGGRETAIDMNVEEPSELAFAAFYADCPHEVRPVASGHRVALVFNLCLRADDERTPCEPPEYGEETDAIAKRVSAWLREDGSPEKIVWLLDHAYSEAGLSFETLKNGDDARARVLSAAADLADCDLHAAVVHIEEHGDAMYGDEHVHGLVLQLRIFTKGDSFCHWPFRGRDGMSVAEWSGSLVDWERELCSWKARLGPVFRRRQLRETGGAFLDGLLSGIERKTGWMMAEQAGLARPWRMQGLLGRNRWDADALRDEVRAYAVEALGSGDGVLVVDETGFVKKGRHSVGVARQYTGTAGRVENSQVGVFLAYAGRFGQALIDRRLYLPRGWAEDGARRAKTQVPEEIAFATKPVLAREMIGEALDAGVPCAFVLADAVYGSDIRLRQMLEQRGQSYVLAVRSNHYLRFLTPSGLIEADPATLADNLDEDAWAVHAAGEGSKGLRLYDWVRISMPWPCPEDRERWLLIRRSRNDPDKQAYYLVFCPAGTTLAELAGAAGLRWTIEECFQRAKDDLGLDHCEARSWHGWHRHISLVMAAAAFLAKLAADLRRAACSKRNETSPNPPVAV